METVKAALVTGGSRGLGARTALMLSALGYRVAFSYIDSQENASDTLGRMTGADSMAVRADVSCLEDVSSLSRLLRRSWGRLDLLVNNAGIARDSLMARADEDEWDKVMSVNLRGAFNTTRELSGLLAESGGGHIINISSRSGIKGKAGQPAYSASKAALIGLTISAARELGVYGIKVNAVVPGYMPTDMGLAAPAAMEAARSDSLIGTLGSVSDIASFMAWLSATTTITGQVFSLDSRV